MSDASRLLFLRIALIVIGLTFIFGIYTLGVLWPSGWTWGQGHSHYLMMIKPARKGNKPLSGPAAPIKPSVHA